MASHKAEAVNAVSAFTQAALSCASTFAASPGDSQLPIYVQERNRQRQVTYSEQRDGPFIYSREPTQTGEV
jgi:hypothetical protein